MEERQVSVDGQPRPLPDPFIVAATQNPIEYEGTYQLPEAQLDRFLLKLNVPLPPRDQEIAILTATRAASTRATCPAGAAGGRRRRPGRRPGRGAAGAGRRRGARLHRRHRRRHPAFAVAAARRVAARVRRRCWPPRGRGPGCPAATTSPPTTSRRWPGRRCGTGWRCGRRPSSRAPPPTACSTASWRPCRCRGSGPHRPHRADRTALRAADRACHPGPQRLSWCCSALLVAAVGGGRRAGGQHPRAAAALAPGTLGTAGPAGRRAC